jgi:benzoyl-CoA reductase subunit C
MGAIEEFQEVYENRHEYARNWKARNPDGKILGCFCTYVPEEIPYAAGILPVRILGSHEIEDESSPHLFGMFCPFCRDVLAQGLQGRYDYLDGIADANCCMHLLQAFEAWALNVKPQPKILRVDTPSSTQNRHSRKFLKGELACFKEDVEEWVGKEITEEALDQAIEVYNANRRLMKMIYELRKAEDPPITGLESMYMVASSQMMDKAEHNIILSAALEELKDRKVDRETGTRLMTVGSENDDVEFLDMIEQKMVLPATVVTDDHCTGTRYFWQEVIPEDDRLKAIATRYTARTPCPCKDFPEFRRFNNLLKLAKEWRVEGVLLMQQKFCDPHESDIPSLKEFFESNGFPTYFLELDVTVPVGQFSTRIEAFIESLMIDII